MIEMHLLSPSKETDNKLRWATFIEEDQTEFKLYIPKWRVPQPWPARILVSIREAESTAPPQARRPSIDPRSPIRARVCRYADVVHSVRFAPGGDPKEWEIGEPYIPYSLLPYREVTSLDIEVQWDMATSGKF